jgi:hypothetical protein
MIEFLITFPEKLTLFIFIFQKYFFKNLNLFYFIFSN